jgi:hypothetical protein
VVSALSHGSGLRFIKALEETQHRDHNGTFNLTIPVLRPPALLGKGRQRGKAVYSELTPESVLLEPMSVSG